MITFLLKSTISLSILLAIYHLLLEKEKIYQFNRFYLLSSLLISLIIPFITIEIVKEITTSVINQNLTFEEGNTTTIIENNTNYSQIIFMAIYSSITLILFSRFIKNLYTIIKKSKINPSLEYQNAELILVDENTLPHTFLNKIFINKKDYNERKIESELFTHELIHVKQKHTLDVLFIEILKTIFWFNPIFIYYKKAIQLNHEFLADEKVVESHKNVPFYQNLLLSKATVNPTYYLASNLNYSVTKKRLIMMTNSTSPTRSLLKKLFIAPLLTGLIFLLCTKTIAQKNTNEKIYNTSELTEKPTYPEGIEAFYKFVGKNFNIPKTPDDVKLKGKVYITFMVEKDGSLTDFRILRDIGYGTGEEAVRVLKLCPNWIPGKVNGKAVKTMSSLPIIIHSKE